MHGPPPHQMHYNQGADLFTYLGDQSVFAIKDGYVDALTGRSTKYLTSYGSLTENGQGPDWELL